RRILEAMDVWPSLEPEVCPIRKVHVSQQKRLGVTRLSAEEENLPALGYVAPNRALGRALMGALEAASNVELKAPAEVIAIRNVEGFAEFDIREGEVVATYRARLVVAAD